MEVIRLLPLAVGVTGLLLTGCSQGPKVVLPRQSSPPIVAVDDPQLALEDGAKQIGALGVNETVAFLGKVKAGSLHVVVKCHGLGVTPVRVSAIPGVFTVPCGQSGEVSYNTIVLDEPEPDVTVRLRPKDGQSVEALIGWDRSRRKPPGFEAEVPA